MDEDQRRTFDTGSAHSDPKNSSRNPFRRDTETSKLRELASRGIDKPETLLLTEIERVCVEVKALLSFRARSRSADSG